MTSTRVPETASGKLRSAVDRRRFLGTGLGAALGVGLAGCAKEGPYPSGPIRMVVPYGAGGGTDLDARSIAPYVQERLGVPLIIENQPGADGRLALSRFARQAADGYTLAFYGIPSMVVSEMLNETAYRVRDFTHLYAWIEEPEVLVVGVDRWPDLNAFLEEARGKRQSCGVTYLTSGARLAGLAMTRASGIEFTWVPFGSAGASLAALLGEHVDFSISALRSALTLIEAGELRPLVVFARRRSPALPEVPIPADLELRMPALPIVRGAVAPAGLDPAVATVIEAAFAGAAQDPEFLAEAEKTGMPVASIGGGEFAELVAESYEAVDAYRDLLASEAQGG